MAAAGRREAQGGRNELTIPKDGADAPGHGIAGRINDLRGVPRLAGWRHLSGHPIPAGSS